MKAVGIIAEYNPFHNGHLYHLEMTKSYGQADCIVAVMSGNFTQRGEPAMVNKWERAEMAVRNGVDLVIELPFIFACNNAEFFAKGAVRILESLGCVTQFSFGSESGDIDKLYLAAKALADEKNGFQEALKSFLDKGISYPKARYEALKSSYGPECASQIKDPNNILAVEYLKECILLKSRMEPLAIKRKGPGYHDLPIIDSIASATSIRNITSNKKTFSEIRQLVPDETYHILERSEPEGIITIDDFFDILVYNVLLSGVSELGEILTAGEGLENKLRKAVSKSKSVSEIIGSVKSKRYTETRIRRLIIHTVMGLRKEDFFQILSDDILYARVLGLSRKGGELLRYIKKHNTAAIPILSNINKELMKEDRVHRLMHYDIAASDLYNLIRYGELYAHSDHVHKPFIRT